MCIIIKPIAHCSPGAVIEHLESPFAWIAASVESNFDLGARTRDDDVVAVLAVVNAPAAV